MIIKGEIESVRYTNDKLNTVEIITLINGSRSVYYASTNESDPAMKELRSRGWDDEKIIDSTAAWKRASAGGIKRAIKNELVEETKRLEEYVLKKLGQTRDSLDKSVILEAIDRYDDDEDSIFRMKLSIFEKENVKAIKDRNAKLKVRKAKSLLEVLSAYYEMIEQSKSE